MIRNSDAPVVFEGLRPGRFRVVAYKWYPSYFNSLRGREKSHIGRIIVKRIDQATFLQNQVFEPCLSGCKPAGQSNRAATYDNNVKLIFHCWKQIYIHSQEP